MASTVERANGRSRRAMTASMAVSAVVGGMASDALSGLGVVYVMGPDRVAVGTGLVRYRWKTVGKVSGFCSKDCSPT